VPCSADDDDEEEEDDDEAAARCSALASFLRAIAKQSTPMGVK
jgi:hypothetical protein